MGLIAACLLLAFLGKMAWDFFTNPGERGKMLAGYAARPISSSFMVVWVAFFLMFFLGIFIPSVGELNLTDDGWQVWEVGILGFFVMWILSWFVDIASLDTK